MLEIQDLHVSVHGTPVLKGIDLKVEAGETFILFGPNGSGKTTLLMTLMGFSGYEVTRGKIIFKGHDITYAPMYERARLGIGMSFQRPPTIHGLPTGKMVELCGRGRKMDIPAMAKRVHFDTFLDRDVNAGFSGGEIKRSELLQLMAQQPNLLLFDEPESGVDLENMALVGKTVRKLLDGVPDCCNASVPPAGSSSPTPATSLNTSTPTADRSCITASSAVKRARASSSTISPSTATRNACAAWPATCTAKSRRLPWYEQHRPFPFQLQRR